MDPATFKVIAKAVFFVVLLFSWSLMNDSLALWEFQNATFSGIGIVSVTTTDSGLKQNCKNTWKSHKQCLAFNSFWLSDVTSLHYDLCCWCKSSSYP